MLARIPDHIKSIVQKFLDHHFQIYLVGGCVRNMLLEKPVKDWDLTTNATPEQILSLFPEGFYDNTFGTVGVPVSKTGELGIMNNADVQKLTSHVVEITTFRTEQNYTDSRHPGVVSWGSTIEEDLERRDFTMNSIALKIDASVIASVAKQSQEITEIATYPSASLRIPRNDGFTLVDPFDGQGDLKNHVVRAVGNPNERFKEDALRLMRAIRFATQLSFTIEEHTWNAMREDSMLLPRISSERIRDELLKILASEYPYEGIMMLKNAELLQHIVPELLEGIGVSQERPGRHHTEDVFTHNVLALKFCPSNDPIVRFATLIHDVGKPRVESTDENGLVIFYNHEVMGARMAYEICERLHFSKKDRKKIVMLIRWHMFTVDEHITDSAVRRFIRRVGTEHVKDMIDLRIGDRLGSGIPESRAESWRLKKFKERIEEQLLPAPFSIHDLVINGNDIIHELAIKPSPQVGKLLQKLFEEVDEDLALNTREHLLKRLKELKEI